MDHQDWPDWSGDEPHLGDADTADLNHPGDALSDFGGDLGGGDLGGHDMAHDMGHDLGGGDLGGGDLGHDLGPDLGPEGGHDLGHHPGGHGNDAYPDDTFEHDADGHDYHAGLEPAGGHAADPAADHSADHPGDHPADPGPDDVPDHPGDHDQPALADHLVGTDPDIDPHTDDAGWHDPEFPPQLDLDHVPPPVDGYPWSDPSVLGAGTVDDAAHLHAGWHNPPADDLLDYAGIPADGPDPWQALLGSDDPATSALARWWAPGS
jgi:hypothetical protein